MSQRNISIKWGNSLVDIAVHDGMTCGDLKKSIASQLHVPPKRQKILGAKLVDSESVPESILSGKQRLLLVGTAEKPTEIKPEPQTGIDGNSIQTKQERISRVLHKEILGIPNLGNTCYLNAAVQMLRSVPELQVVFKEHINVDAARDPLLSLLQQVLLDESNMADQQQIIPFAFLQAFHSAYPAFAERTPEGFLMQHDAQEALSVLLAHIERAMGQAGEKTAPAELSFRDLFQLTLCDIFLCTEKVEGKDEEKLSQHSQSLMLLCRLHAETATIEQGMQNAFDPEIIEKHSPFLERNAQWERRSEVERLPKYVFVHIARFSWRQDTAQKAKILKTVNFPLGMSFDRFVGKEHTNDAANAHLKADYSLSCVISHKGRTGDSGHYVAWTKKDLPKEAQPGEEGAAAKAAHAFWVVIDDENKSIVSEDDIKRLSGGGESHSAYVLLYKRAD